MHIRFYHNMHPCLSAGGWGGLNLLPNFQKRIGALTGPQVLEGVAGKEGIDVIQGRGKGGLQFYKKQKLKYEIFNE